MASDTGDRAAFHEAFKAALAEDRAARKQDRDAVKESVRTGGRVGRTARKVRAGLATGGKMAAAAAKNNATGVFVEGLQGAASAVEKFGVAGKATAEVLTTAAAAVQTFKVVVDAFAERARELEFLSPDIAGASARADVRRLNTDMNEAEAIGPQLAKLLENQSKMEAIFSATLLPIKEWALETLNNVMMRLMEMFADGLECLNMILDKVSRGTLTSEAIAKTVARIRGILEEKDPESPLDNLLKAGMGFVAPGRPAAPGAAPDPGPPILGAFVDGVDAGWWRRR
ncbi:unnamed protein product [Gemmataceae bacterium]|nr:unnamed protein product [Gemmataceae bacterium]VTT96566.1 unnamed protein product [Gemmataceae bacterium]